MKRIILVIGIVFAGFVSSFGQTDAESLEIKTKAGREVLATIAKWADAVKSRNTKELEALFTDDIVITTFDGKTRGKSEELEILKPNENVRTVSIKNEDVKIRVFGRAAVVTALTKMHFIVSGKDSHAAFRYTAVFVKEDGRWQIVALQTARAPLEPLNSK